MDIWFILSAQGVLATVLTVSVFSCVRVCRHVHLCTPCFTVCVVCSVFELSHVGICVQVCSCCLGVWPLSQPVL